MDAGNGGHALVEVVPAGLKGLPHDLDLILGAAEGLGGGGLGDGAGAGEAVAEVVAHDLDDLLAGCGKADAPAGHGVGLGGAAHQDGAGLDLLAQGGEGDELLVVKDQLAVHLVGDDVQVVVQADLGDVLQVLPAVDHAGGVGGAVEHQGLGLGGDGGLELLRGQVEAVLLRGGDDHGHAADHFNEFIVAHPIGGGQNHLVAGVDESLEGDIEDGLAAAADNDLLRGVVQAPVGVQPVGHGLAHGGGAGSGGVFGQVFLDRADPGLLDVFGSGEIGLTDAEADHVDALGAHLVKLGVNGQSGGCPNRLGKIRQCFHNSRPPDRCFDFFNDTL